MDDLDLYVAEQSEKDPKFLDAYEAALERRRIASRLAEVRAAKGLSQESLAKAARSTQAVISRLEAGGDFKFSTLQKVTHALGFDDVSEALVQVSGAGARRAAPKKSKRREAVGKRAAGKKKAATKTPRSRSKAKKERERSTHGARA